jgi:hypothetical protein
MEQELTQKLAAYYILYQKCSDGVRHLSATRLNSLHDEAYRKWQGDPSNPLFEPPRNDKKRKASYFAKCDEICRIEPKFLEEYVVNKPLLL